MSYFNQLSLPNLTECEPGENDYQKSVYRKAADIIWFLWLKGIQKKTSLKIFKQYKLKPSFPIIKDNKAKDKVGVGDKPPPSSFNNLIKFDPI